MDIVQLLFKANTSEIDKAASKLDDVGKKSEKAQSHSDKLGKSLGSLKDVGGPIGDVANQVDSLQSRLAAARSSAVLLGPALIAVAGAAGVLAAIRFAPVLDDMGDLATILGINVSTLAALDSKLQAFGGAKAFQADIDKVARALSRADEESSRAAKAFEFLGINTKDAASAQDVLSQVVDEYAEKVQTGNVTLDEQQALILALGPAYKEMIFRQQEAAKAMGIYNEFAEQQIRMSEQGTEAAGDFGDANDRMSYAFKVMGSQLVADIVPAFTSLITALTNSYKNGGLVYGAFQLMRAAADLLMVPIRALINIFIDLDTAVQSVGKSFSAVWQAISTGSLDPLKALGSQIEDLIKKQEKLKVGPLGFSSDGQNDYSNEGRNSRTPGKTGFTASNGSSKPKDTSITDSASLGWSAYGSWGSDGRKEAAYAEEQRLAKQKEIKDAYRAAEEKQLQQFFDRVTAREEQYVEEGQARFKASQEARAKEIESIQKVGEFAFQSLSQAMMDFAVNGETSFKGFLSSFLKGLGQMVFQIGVITPMMEAFKASLPGGSGSGGFLGSIFSAVAGSFGGSGGVKLATGTNYVPYDGMKAVLHEGEAVVPKKYNPAAGGSMAAGMSIGQISIVVQGGKTNEETGAALNKELLKTMQQVADGRIANARRVGGLLNA